MPLPIIAKFKPETAFADETEFQILETPFDTFEQAVATFATGALVPCNQLQVTQGAEPGQLQVVARRAMAIRGDGLARITALDWQQAAEAVAEVPASPKEDVNDKPARRVRR